MDPYRPVSKRDIPDPDLDTPHETVVSWMIAPLVRWLEPFFLYRANFETGVRDEFVDGLEMATRSRDHLDRSSIMQSVEARLASDPQYGLDAADYALRTMGDGAYAPELIVDLARLLKQSGSAWGVTEIEVGDETRWTLTRRDLEAARRAVAEIRSQQDRAGAFLKDAWQAVATRDPQPNEGYSKAIMAIEVAAQPVVSPDNTNTTLGTIIANMRDKPAKWTFALGDLSLIIDMADRVWTAQFRHGTQERADHTLEETDAALHLAIPLVRYFVGGLITRAET